MLDEISEMIDLIKDLKINSAKLVDIIIDEQSKYNIEIDLDSAEQKYKVDNIIDVITDQMSKTT
jgi:acyl carrier protein